MNTEVEEMEAYQIFFVLMGNTEITKEPDLQAPQDSETPNNKIRKKGMIWIIKKHLRIQYHQVIR